MSFSVELRGACRLYITGRRIELKKYASLVRLSLLFLLITTIPPAPARQGQPYQPLNPPAAPVEQAMPPPDRPPAPVTAGNGSSPGPAGEPDPPATPPSPAARRHHVLGYFAVDYPGDTASSRSLRAFAGHIDSIASFSFRTDGHGNLSENSPREGAELARARGTTALALIHNYVNGSFNVAVAHSLLTSKANRQRLIENTIKILQKYGYQGVNVDLENIPPGDRPYYSALILEFKEALQPRGYLTTVSIAAKTWDDPGNPWAGAFDYRDIGQHADWVQIM
ncbi:MAG: hypothetical protein H5T99_09165, partial [Moorella sp. (in: Bacteria)]|nr:hypothetical protein [Moorella sp. (in: firmicutes)]